MTPEQAPRDRNLLGPLTLVIAGVVLVAAGVIAVMIWRAVGRDREPADLPKSFVFDVSKYKVIPPEKIGYREVARIETGLEQATALAVGPDGTIAVGGDTTLLLFTAEGAPRGDIPFPETPTALTFSGDDYVFASSRRSVRHGRIPGPLGETVEFGAEKTHFTALAVREEKRDVHLYVADAGARCVHVMSFGPTSGGMAFGKIGIRDPDRNVPGFSVPSPYFDVLVAPDGLLRIVDPGRLRIDAFTVDGDLEFSWGKHSFALEGFCGCCNPSHLAMLPDGGFVTSEKGIPRVKVYDADGRFVTAVVGPEGLDTEKEPCDVAVDGRGRILVLDPGSSAVRVFEPKER